ncbi:hypothetical protein GEMRC1_003591 [Eukaryota sp. GEM-RC1]
MLTWILSPTKRGLCSHSQDLSLFNFRVSCLLWKQLLPISAKVTKLLHSFCNASEDPLSSSFLTSFQSHLLLSQSSLSLAINSLQSNDSEAFALPSKHLLSFQTMSDNIFISLSNSDLRVSTKLLLKTALLKRLLLLSELLNDLCLSIGEFME